MRVGKWRDRRRDVQTAHARIERALRGRTEVKEPSEGEMFEETYGNLR